ncbi:hypothetical protein OG599_35070 (plasmid) [Streptomyces sp. NBC_01335]|uniref:hypothetical protein n=1 Tax=Streptomyces sp. NBC_01335 TaxID=2903828 RepID=UPI002E0F43B8|nr:hypothetical protein OG599_35070 [Streptomyces sp. NBC_01335]
MLSPYGGPVPAGYAVHAAESAAWRAWAAMVYPRQAPLRLALDPAVGRALAELPADLALVSSYTPAELAPLLPAFGWETLPPLVPLRETGSVHYLRVEDPGRCPDAKTALYCRSEEIVSWARTHDRPVAWVRAGAHHQEQLRRTLGYLSAVGPLRAHPVAPATGLTAADLDALREWAREMSLRPEPAPVVPRRCRDCGDRSTTVRDGRRADRVHARCGSCCECWCPDPSEDRFQPCGDLLREQCPDCRCCLNCVGCHCGE